MTVDTHTHRHTQKGVFFTLLLHQTSPPDTSRRPPDRAQVTVGETTTNVPAGEALAHAGVGHGRGARSGVEWLRVDGRDGEVGGK